MKLPPDWRSFIASLCANKVRFVIVGAHALAVHGRPRATQDLDILVAPTEANARRVAAALDDFGFSSLARAWRRFTREDCFARLGLPPLQIDVLTSITGVTFAAAWRGRVMVDLDGLQVPFLGEAELRRNKAATGRAKDALDLELLGPPLRRPAHAPRGGRRRK
ncbi:MAG: hypothetical protein K8M05_21450 [Deltaproteobacteria bacterium]|nr:hypothetical protein [Kofleriaceae bacterium]